MPFMPDDVRKPRETYPLMFCKAKSLSQLYDYQTNRVVWISLGPISSCLKIFHKETTAITAIPFKHKDCRQFRVNN